MVRKEGCKKSSWRRSPVRVNLIIPGRGSQYENTGPNDRSSQHGSSATRSLQGKTRDPNKARVSGHMQKEMHEGNDFTFG